MMPFLLMFGSTIALGLRLNILENRKEIIFLTKFDIYYNEI